MIGPTDLLHPSPAPHLPFKMLSSLCIITLYIFFFIVMF